MIRLFARNHLNLIPPLHVKTPFCLSSRNLYLSSSSVFALSASLELPATGFVTVHFSYFPLCLFKGQGETLRGVCKTLQLATMSTDSYIGILLRARMHLFDNRLVKHFGNTSGTPCVLDTVCIWINIVLNRTIPFFSDMRNAC